MVVKGRFLSIDEGNMTQRMVIGFGLGRSVVKAQGQAYEVTPLGTRLISEFESEVKSGRKPGMGPMVGVGAAAGSIATSAAVSGDSGSRPKWPMRYRFQPVSKPMSKKWPRNWLKREPSFMSNRVGYPHKFWNRLCS
ncbi:MAG: DUF4410 domain-containing protein [Nitrospirales bacterium]|nr:DUF4410 domain-containing protein [Nitrospirales bacterium]